ncbi:MAG: sulfatase-like hydrolase/transferase, partial [Cyclobacteriaceae bacterium]|nr:sulfatase-like hydrolase/transferase [Cyclobacteriaceae bacterium]
MEKPQVTFLRLIFQVLSLLFLFLLCRLFFVLFNASELNLSSVFSVFMIFLGGLRFDIHSVIIANLIYILFSIIPLPYQSQKIYQYSLKTLFIFTNSLFILLNLIDIAYFPFIHKRMQADALLFVSGEKGTDFFYLIPTFLGQFWYLWLLFIIFIGAIWKIYDYSNSIKIIVPRSLKSYLGSLMLFIGVAALAFLGVRGGLQLKPLQLIHASNMTEVQNIPALINTPFSLYSTVTKEKLPEVQYFTKEELNETDHGIHSPIDSVQMNNQNVVLIIVESFSKKYLGYFNDQAQTPFLDSLTNEGLIFTNGFANATESIQGIPALISSIPSLMDESFIFSPYSTNKITSIP